MPAQTLAATLKKTQNNRMVLLLLFRLIYLSNTSFTGVRSRRRDEIKHNVGNHQCHYDETNGQRVQVPIAQDFKLRDKADYKKKPHIVNLHGINNILSSPLEPVFSQMSSVKLGTLSTLKTPKTIRLTNYLQS